MANTLKNLKEQIFNISDEIEFDQLALEIFRHQATHVDIYKNYIRALNIVPDDIHSIKDIPFLPIDFFKTHEVLVNGKEVLKTFYSSGTTGMDRSKHHISDLKLYEKSIRGGFEKQFGPIEDYTFLALLPSYMENESSSLIYMVQKLIEWSGQEESGFYLEDSKELLEKIKENEGRGRKSFLVGVTYALLDLAENVNLPLRNTIICETGGMKGRRKEMIREEVHSLIKKSFKLQNVHSEYGMTELMSQAWSHGSGVFETPLWMKIMIRDTHDPFEYLRPGKTGGINVIDLANIESCSFISTYDLGREVGSEEFEILGRFDNSDLRGCNLLVL